MKKPVAAILVLCCLGVSAALAAEPGPKPRPWTITPYLWLPTINSDLQFDLPGGEEGSSVESEIGPSDYLTNLNGVLMVAAEFRHARWSYTGDLIWLDLTADASTVRTVSGDGGAVSLPRQTNLGTETDLSGVSVTLTAGRAVGDGERWNVTALGGVRYFTLEADLNWNLTTAITGPGFTFARQGSVSADTDLYDAVIGARGKVRLGRDGHWYLPWYADVGTGSSDLTWQAMAGVGYAFERSNLLLVWRQLEYDDDGALLRELRFGGLAVGFGWSF